MCGTSGTYMSGQWRVLYVFLYCALPYCPLQEASQLTVLVRLSFPGPTCLCLSPSVGVKAKSSHTRLFTWVLGIQTQTPMLTQQALSPTELSPLPPPPASFMGLTTSHLSQISFPSPSALPFITRGWPLCPVVSSWIWWVRHKQEEEIRTRVDPSVQGQGSCQQPLAPSTLSTASGHSMSST